MSIYQKYSATAATTPATRNIPRWQDAVASYSVLALLSVTAPCAVGAELATASAADKSSGLEEIVVTATRREENLQSVPIDVSVVTADQIANSGFKSLGDLQNLSAGAYYAPFTSNGGGFTMRGVGTANFDYSVEQGVSIVVDDVVLLMHRAFGLIGLNDVERIELLAGPQGMLFGKNADSGVVSVTTKRPVLGEFSANASAELGIRDDRSLHSTVNLPVNDTIAMTLSAFTQGENGPGYYRAPSTPQTAGDVQETGGRAKLLYQPSTDLDMLLTADYAQHKDSEPYIQGFAPDPVLYATLSAYGAQPSIHNTNSADSTLSEFDRKEYGASLKINYRISDFTLTSVSAYRGGDFTGNAPVSMTPSLFFPINVATMGQHQITQEIRLASPGRQFLDYVAGLYYSRLTERSTQEQAGQLGDTTLPDNTYLSLTNGQDVYGIRDSSAAAFGQAIAHFTDRLDLTAGVRYTHDTQFSSLAQIPVTNYTTIDIGGVPEVPSGSAVGNNISYRISPAFQITPDVKVYATYSTGYKAPGVATTSAVIFKYKAEKARLWELGLKSEFFDHNARLNLAIFDEDYRNFQASETAQVGQLFIATVNNAGELRSRGADADLNFRLSRDLSLSASVNFSDAVYRDYVQPGGADYSGDRLPNSSRWSTALSLDYSKSAWNGYLATAHIEYSWKSDIYGAVGNRDSIIPGHGTLGMRAGLGPEDGTWRAGFYGRNLTNAVYPSGAVAYNGIVQTFTPDAKRTVGLFFEFRH